ncbi:MAG: sugar phosphate isomerase/epimerase [Clostridia bacterium]|nr:sugar phosphate isomerase/epimerase [Clostridia bacterium]
MKIATTTGDFLGYTKPGDISSALTLLADAGFRYADINLSDLVFYGSPLCGDSWEAWAEDIGNTAARLGIGLVQAHASDSVYDRGAHREYRTSMIERELWICGKLGIPAIVVHGLSKAGGEREDFMETNAAFYGELLATAEKTGVTVCTENTCRQNAPTYYLFDGKDLNELCARVNHPLFGACWDVGHGHCHGVDVYEVVTTLGKNLKVLHVHDNYATADLHIQPYAGNFCYDALLQGLKDSGYAGCFTLEAFCTPVAANFCFCNRKAFVKDGVTYNKVQMPPVSFKIRSERLMLDTVQWMLDAYEM